MQEQTDKELLDAYEEGDPDAIDTLVRRYLKPVYSLVSRLVGFADAEDVTQETFFKAWGHLSSFDRSRSFKTWIFRIARNASIDHLRKKKSFVFSAFDREDEDEGSFEASLPDPEPLADELFEKKENARALEAALSELSPDERAIITMHEAEAMSFEQIGEVLDKPMNTVKSRYRRALFKLRSSFEAAQTSGHQNPYSNV